jgi:aspartate kinase
MTILIMKFGGAAVADPEKFLQIADIIILRKAAFEKIVVVISAMGGATDQLIQMAKRVNDSPPSRELDMLVSVGERISMSLLAMALAKREKKAISFTGSQSGIITTTRHSDARIINVKPKRIQDALDKGYIAIVAGFQGVSTEGEITTLGRGGSDTTAVALAASLQTKKVEFYKDVEGLYSKNPKIYKDAKLLKKVSYEEAYQMTINGAKILHPRCVKLAEKNGIALQIMSFVEFDNQIENKGTLVGNSSFEEKNAVFEEIED